MLYLHLDFISKNQKNNYFIIIRHKTTQNVSRAERQPLNIAAAPFSRFYIIQIYSLAESPAFLLFLPIFVSALTLFHYSADALHPKSVPFFLLLLNMKTTKPAGHPRASFSSLGS